MKYKMDRMIRKYCKRLVKKKFPGEGEEINKKAEEIFKEFCSDTPDIGYGKNIMAGNLYQFLTFLSFYEASGRRITTDDIESVASEMLEDMEKIGRYIDINNPGICWLLYKIAGAYSSKVKKMKAKGMWGNTWDVLINPENHDTGFSFHLVGCPLCDFAKSHGYEDMLPTMCKIDYETAALIHARLIRTGTIASGADSCDYWYVGNRTKIQ